MKYRKVFLLTFCACAFSMLYAFKYWNVRSILTSTPWTSVETWNDFDSDGTFVLDTMQCRQDNDWVFSLTGSLMIIEDSLSCEPDMPYLDTIRGFWTMENNDTRLKFSFISGGNESNMDLHSIGPNEVEFHFSDSEDPNDTVTRQRIILRR